MEKPKVIILSAFLSPFRSGAEACTEEVAIRLADRFDITIVTARLRRDLPRKDSLKGKVAVRRVGLGFGFDKWLFPFLAPCAVWMLVGARRGRALSSKVDMSQGAPTGRPYDQIILHAVLETFAGLALHYCKIIVPSAKRLLTLQTTNRTFLKATVLRSPHRVTAISAALAEQAKILGRADSVIIPNGVDIVAFPEKQKVPGRILFVGRLERMKGLDILLDAFAKLVENFPQAHLRIVGDGSEALSLMERYPALRETGRIVFVGRLPIPAVYSEFAQAEIFCGLSRSEALGNVFLEAQAAGCAVVATRTGGIPEIVQDGVTGILVPPQDVQAARSALGRLLKDASLRKLLAEQGKTHAQKYDWSVVAERYATVYEELLRPV